MTGDASRSCLGLATSVGSAIRQIVDARVLLTATAPPALPGSRLWEVLPAPPLPVITRFLQSACWDRHLASDGPDIDVAVLPVADGRYRVCVPRSYLA